MWLFRGVVVSKEEQSRCDIGQAGQPRVSGCDMACLRCCNFYFEQHFAMVGHWPECLLASLCFGLIHLFLSHFFHNMHEHAA